MRGGRVVGSSDSRGAFPRENAKTPQDVLATIYQHLGVDTRVQYTDNVGRPHPALPGGRARAFPGTLAGRELRGWRRAMRTLLNIIWLVLCGFWMALGYALGRIGCFLVGDDYGRPTNSWIGIAFPKGSPPTTAESLRQFGVRVDPSIPPDQILRVHPTQLYESAAAFVIFLVLFAVGRRPHPKGRIFGLFFLLMGIERFLVEIVRAKDDRFLGPFTIAQLISVLIAIAGAYLLTRKDRIVEPAKA